MPIKNQHLQTDTKRYVPVVTLSTVVTLKRYLDLLIDPSFQGVNRLFVLSFESNVGRFLLLVEIKDYNVMLLYYYGNRWTKLFDKPAKYNLITCDNIRKMAAGQGDGYTIGCLLDYPYFKNFYKMITIDLTKQQALDGDPKGIQKINFTANLDRDGNTMIFMIEEAKETILGFSKGTVKVLL